MLKKAKRIFVSRDKMRKPVERRKIRIELEATIEGSRTATLTVDVRNWQSLTKENLFFPNNIQLRCFDGFKTKCTNP